MNEIGSDIWLGEFLDVLSLSENDYTGHDALRPNLVVVLSRSLEGEHEQIITRETWINANSNLIDKIGSYEWLEKLLTVLETDILEKL